MKASNTLVAIVTKYNIIGLALILHLNDKKIPGPNYVVVKYSTSTIPDNIFGTKQRNPVKSDRTRKT